MEFSERLKSRSEAKRAHLKKPQDVPLDDELTESEDDQFKAVISTRHEIVVKRNKRKSEDEKENTSRNENLSKAAHDRLQKLTALYSDECPGPSSPIHKPHVTFSPTHDREEKSHSKDRLAEARAQRLAALAQVINDWEDESDKKVQLKTKKSEIKTKPELKGSPQPSQSQKFLRPTGDKTVNHTATISPSKSPSPQKKFAWDNKMIRSLEAQGYQRCDSENHLIYDYKSPKSSPAFCSTTERSPKKIEKPIVADVKTKSPVKKFDSPRKSNVSELAAKYEETSPSKKVKDPTELSIMERKALFEKNKGGAILPKVPFGTPVPAKILASSKNEGWNATPTSNKPKDVVSESIQERRRELEELKNRWEKKRATSGLADTEAGQVIERCLRVPTSQTIKRNWAHSNTTQESPVPQPPPMPQQSSSPKRIKMGVLSPVRGVSSESDDVLSPIEKPKSPRKSDGYKALEEIKPIRISPPKPGHIYPSVSDIETESEVPESDFENQDYSDRYLSSDESSMSLGQAIVNASKLSRSNLKRMSNNNTMSDSENMSEQESRIVHEMDDFLDEALGGVSPPKKSKDSFSSEIERGMSSCPSGSTRCDSFEFTTDDDTKKEVQLVHTVSMYRKQGSSSQTPVRKEIHVDSEIEDWNKPKEKQIPEEILVKARIKELENEMVKQTTIISQASQALNLCHSRIEFSGSPEQVEAERLLLLSTCTRTAVVREIERLKVEKKLKPGAPQQDNEKGDLIIHQITLPVRPVQYPSNYSPDKVDYFVCLATSGATVLSTNALPAKGKETSLVFKKPLKFDKLFPDFTVSLEVYRLSTESSSDFIPHEVKYGIHSEKKKEKLRLTPQKKSKSQKVIESPGGPNAVRSPAFQLNGFAVFSLREINRTKFTLSKVPYGAPIEGSLEIKMTTELKTDLVYKGFLTLFEEISGFGAWRRRWAVLSGTVISLWAYPEHEDEKIPIDTIDLTTSKTKKVDLVRRDVCARPHTILLETANTRFLMSADSVEDRVGWCKAINKSLYLISAWGNQSKP